MARSRGLPLGRFALLALFAVGALIFSPSLRSSFLLDDYLHAAMVEGTFPSPRAPYDLYNFVSDADHARLFERGLFPWWTHPRLTIRFCRPLASALLWAEHHAFGRHPLAPHLVSLAWWALAVVAARALFRRSFSPRVAWIATVAFALAPCHAIPLAWLANSEALVTLALGTLGLGAYARWRDERRARDGALAAGLFALAMLSGEYALAFGGYVLAIELVRRGERAARRGVGLLPFVVPAAAYLLVRARLGYGTAGSGFYSDPVREPLALLAALPWRLSALLANLWLTLDLETTASGAGRWAVGLLVVAAGAFLVVPLRRALAGLDAEAPRRTALWMLLGSGLALAPVLAVAPSGRLVGVSTLGVAALVALLLEHAWFPAPGAARDRATELTGFVALLLAFAHLVHGPALAWLAGRRLRQTAADFASSMAHLRTRVGDPARTTFTVLRGGGASFFAPFAIDPHGTPPAHWRVLALTGHVLVLRRGPRTLELVAPRDQGVFLADRSNLFRSGDAPFRAGDVVQAPGVRVTVVEAGEHGPRDVVFDFDRDLDAPDQAWIAEDQAGFELVRLPQIGFGMPLDP